MNNLQIQPDKRRRLQTLQFDRKRNKNLGRKQIVASNLRQPAKNQKFFCAKNKYDYIPDFVKVRGLRGRVYKVFYWRGK